MSEADPGRGPEHFDVEERKALREVEGSDPNPLPLGALIGGLVVGAIVAHAVGVAKQPAARVCECERFIRNGQRPCCVTCRCGRTE